MFIFPVQLTMSRIGNLTRLIHTLLYVLTIHTYIPWSKRDTAGYLLSYSVKRTQLSGRRPLSPCRVRKTAGYTLPRLLFSRTVPRFSEMYPDLAGSGTLPSAIFSVRIIFRIFRSPSKGHQKPNLPALNKQWQPALPPWAGGPLLLPKNIKTSTLPLLNIQCVHIFLKKDVRTLIVGGGGV